MLPPARAGRELCFGQPFNELPEVVGRKQDKEFPSRPAPGCLPRDASLWKTLLIIKLKRLGCLGIEMLEWEALKVSGELAFK